MRLRAISLLPFLVAPALAATPDGFMTIGGVGGVKCTVYTNSVAEARTRWGLSTPEALNALNPYIQYVFGFLMGYNAVSSGVYDIAAGIREDMPISVITMVDTYCQEHPTDVIDNAVFDVLKKLMPSAHTEMP